MSESRQFGFWAGLVVFQLVFGLVVFGVTRQFYLAQNEPMIPRGAAATFPTAFPQGFQDAISSLPAAPADAELQSPEDIARRADERFQAREYLQAAELYQRLVELDPTSVDLLNNLGITLHYLGRSAEAIERLNEGVAIDPNHQRTWLTLGFVNSQIGETEAARAALTSAFRLGPDNDIGESAASMIRDMGFEISLD